LQQAVSEEDLVEGKRIDNDDYVLAKKMLLDVKRKMDGLGSIATSGDLIRVRERLEEVVSVSLVLGER
jgi:hypothetical protein